MKEDAIEKLYKAGSSEELRAAYEAWANRYDQDLMSTGYRLPALVSTVALKFLGETKGPILDAGCGTGLHAEVLPQFGMELIGLDPSPAMLEVARAKNIYAHLYEGGLGDGLSQFGDNQFEGALSSGAITPGHAGPSSFDDLIRVVTSGGKIVFSLREDAGQDPAYQARIDALKAEGAWREIFSSERIQTLPYSEPEVFNRVNVMEVL